MSRDTSICLCWTIAPFLNTSTIHRPTNVKCLKQEVIDCEDESEHYDKRRMMVMMVSSSVAIGCVGKTKKISNARALNTGDDKTAVMAWKARYNL